MIVDPAWHKEQINKYIIERSHYEKYAAVLSELLKRACKLYTPLAIVQARAKTITSFAEKAARKAYKYRDPVHQITDLCGARVVTQTQDEVKDICKFIEANFAVDEANSLDTRARMKETEFGYLSFHYVVQMKRRELLGVPIPIEEIGERKAEIQVRTLLQHAWADITHDRLYKEEIKIPRNFYRDGAILAAELEDADGAFGRFIHGLDAYTGNYAAYMSKDKMLEEMEILRLIMRNKPEEKSKPEDDDNPGIALRIAKIAKASGDYETVVKELKPYAKTPGLFENEITMELGYGLCRKYENNSKSTQFREGQSRLEEVTERVAEVARGTGPGSRQAKKLSATAFSYLAWTYSITGPENKARDKYHQAMAHEPSDPYHLASLLEYEVYCTHNRDFLAAMKPALLEAISACRAHADMGIELPRAFFTMGKLYLLMEEPYESLTNYVKGVQLCLTENACVSDDVFDTEMEFLQRINTAREMPQEHEWVKECLLLGKSVKTCNGGVSNDIKALALRRKKFKKPVLIIAGGTDTAVKEEMAAYRAYLEAALADFDGTVISGGTTAGIPGIVGEITEKLRIEGAKKYTAIGYISRYLPNDAPKDERYDELEITEGKTLSPLEPLQNWKDLLTAGVQPPEVRLLGINGGRIAALEYRLAMALGATVGVIDFSGRAVSDLLFAPDWSGSPNLMQIPKDIMSIRAFVNPGKSQLSPEIIGAIARSIHKQYRKDNKHKTTDPAMQPYDKLSKVLKDSNLQQATYAEQILKQVGFGIRQPSGKIRLQRFTREQVEKMAEMEHGRWNVERLKAGWKYGPVRDVANNISPFLTPWKNLPEDVKEYDRKAIKDWPVIFQDAGLEIYKLE